MLKKSLSIGLALLVCILAGTSCITVGGAPSAGDVAGYRDLVTSPGKVVPGEVYRMGQTGICGTVEENHVLVTHVIPGSPAHGKIKKGDLIRALQHRGMGKRGAPGRAGIRVNMQVRLYRIGRDYDWHLYVTVERPSLRGGKGNTVTYDLRIPPDPGRLCHYGPTGFFAKRYSDHLVVDVVAGGSPSAGKLQKGDIIVSVDGQPITIDAYNQFTKAIDKAESREGGGKLELTIKRPAAADAGAEAEKAIDKARDKVSDKGSSLTPDTRNLTPISITLQLKVLGSYSKTAPVNCAKTDALITQTADRLLRGGGGALHASLLGLLATGEEKYIKAVRGRLPDAAAPKDLNELVGKSGGYVAWKWGYTTLVLTEYYLLTRDKSVLPAITKYARGLASGQDPAGLWGHQMCHKEPGGRSPGYGVMNQPALTCFLGLILAEKCGVKDPMVRAAIKRTHAHYNKWIGQGALPYGNHQPMEHLFTNNGTSGSLALAFALLGNKKGARFYAEMSAAATDEILTGHGGPWWNILWSGLGANVLGPEMAAVYNRKIHWLRTVTRCWDGRHVGMLGWGSSDKPGKLSDTGNHLINLCASRRAIHLTGKGVDKSLWVSAEEAEKIVEAGEVDTSSEKALLASLGSSLPPVRLRAAQGLAKRDADVTDEVMKLLAGGTTDERVGAIYAIGNLKIEGAVDELLAIAMNEKDDLWVRRRAVGALSGSTEARKHASKLLELLVRDKPYDQPYGELDLSLGSALTKLYQPDPYATALDKDLFYQGVSKLLNHKHAWARGAGMALIKNMPMEDLHRIVDKMIYVIEDKDGTYMSYTGAGRQEALDTLYRLGVKESMDLTINTVKGQSGRGGPRVRARTRLLKTFGAEAKYLIPRIKEVLGKGADPIVKQIEESKTERKMIPLAEIRKMGDK